MIEECFTISISLEYVLLIEGASGMLAWLEEGLCKSPVKSAAIHSLAKKLFLVCVGAIYTTTSFFLAQVAILVQELLLGRRRTHGAEIGPFSRGNWVALHLTLTTTVVETRIAEVLASQQRCFYYCCLAPRPRHVIATLCVAAARIWKIQWSYSRKLQPFWSSAQKDWKVWNRRRREKWCGFLLNSASSWLFPLSSCIMVGFDLCYCYYYSKLKVSEHYLSSLRCTTYRVSK